MALLNNHNKYFVSFSNEINNPPNKEDAIANDNSKYILPYLQARQQTHETSLKTVNDKSQVSKLRHILTEAISNINKENTLKKGESVELTLEIELLKSNNNTPTNSLVEVTILQHNISENTGNKNKINLSHLNNKKMPCDVDIEQPVNGQGSCFKGFVNNQYDKGSVLNKTHTNKITDTSENKNKFKTDQTVCFATGNEAIIPNKDYKKNFYTILPKQRPVNGTYNKKEHRKMTDKSDVVSKQPKDKIATRDSKKNTLLSRQISDVILPTKKEEKSKAVNTVVTALSNGVKNIKCEAENNNNIGWTKNKGEKRSVFYNLEKVVSNSLVDMVDSSDSQRNQVINFKHFFEPVISKTKKRRNRATKQKLFIKKSILSHSDTCIPQYTEKQNVKLKKSISETDFRSIKKFTMQTKLPQTTHCLHRAMGDSIQVNTGKKTKKEKHLKHHLRNNGRGDIRTYSSNKLKNYNLKCIETKKSTCNHKSTIYWDGETFKVNKDVKRRIELLIFNELQNLALKEGMECDITPLPSSDNTFDIITRVEKMSSFTCELDISDAKIKKTMKNMVSLDSKYRMKQSYECVKKNTPQHSRNKVTDKTITSSSVIDKSNNDTNTTHSTKTNLEITNEENITNKTNNEYELQVKYLNLNLKNWSDESYDTGLNPSKEQTEKNKKPKTQLDENALLSGFAKRITSKDSIWNTFLSGKNLSEKRTNGHKNNTDSYFNIMSKHFSSLTSKECKGKIEIELDIQDLEVMLREAKEIHKASKILICTNCNNCNSYKYKKQKKCTGKNSPSYTNQLLTDASRKLENLAKQGK